MALGMTGFEDFKPKASKTAASLLSVSMQGQVKKDKQIQLRIDYDKFLLFQEICSSSKIDMSTAIRRYIDEVIAKGTI